MEKKTILNKQRNNTYLAFVFTIEPILSSFYILHNVEKHRSDKNYKLRIH